MIYEKDMFKNPNITAVFGHTIYEYDIESAGFNISRQFKLLPQYRIDKLSKLPKKKRHIDIGYLMKNDKTYKENLKTGFMEARKFLFTSNELDDGDVIGIKKDAIFSLKPCEITKLGYINFRVKNQYTSYIRLGTIEIFYNSDIDKFDIKGMDDNVVPLHYDGILLFLKKYIKLMEANNSRTMMKLMRFVNRYKQYELPAAYYRTFDVNSHFVEKTNSDILDCVYDDYDDNYVDDLDISYNFINVIVPLVTITMKLISQ